VRAATSIPLIASGGAGEMAHFKDVFEQANVNGALAASVFHSGYIPIPDLKSYLVKAGVEIRP
jgi:cyclase